MVNSSIKREIHPSCPEIYNLKMGLLKGDSDKPDD
jgi:hypothetical protein